MSYFINTAVNIVGNKALRLPQIEAYLKIQEYFSNNPSGEALVVLPTGTGKTGLISIAPFGVCNGRVLIITPGLVTKQSIRKSQEVLEDNFWVNFDIIFNPDHMPSILDYDADSLSDHLVECNIIYSNIQRVINSRGGCLLDRVPPDFFDMIIIDEAHHAPAESWAQVLRYFSKAKKLHVTGTPFRGDNQELPGERIHETSLSDVMRDRYVKWLRKETVNASELFFTMPERPGVKLTKEDVLELKEKEWVEKCVALSKSCSLDVIDHSIKKLNELNETSPAIPHKILAVGCSISHAEDLKVWYEERGQNAVIIHSEMDAKYIDEAFAKINAHQCDVVISVNMLMEGYDHRYLTILAIFRPYRSINAFAQVVGRVLRVIPEDEITAFEIDNNAVVIYHEETGLDVMWDLFQKEVDRATQQRTKEYGITDREYIERDNTLASVSAEDSFVSDKDSYLDDIDFNELFAKKREEIKASVDAKVAKIQRSQDNTLDEDELDALQQLLLKRETQKASQDIDPNLIEKRPAQARKQMREILVKRIQDEVTNILVDLNISAKGTNLATRFSRIISSVKTGQPNDGTLVLYVNSKLYSKFGAVKDRDNKALLQSIETIPSIVVELRKMLS
ncbi:DEAD/DEAH box helicase family protein [Chromobacterium violaceum]|uniref:DEAD/DEAH box helicase n=1 Tax=Chromobacterium violaceum TaxID=536 RepID=UPI001B32F499|nr:DEAD/DEAH box helicase family protein [Chromobacterium violaceum]MBP4049118.1 DEAD/DEAH box helicase family protein [Chromobacterium violaceum]